MSKKMIALDIGDVRIGVAKCDPLGILATAHCVIDRTKEDPIKKILEICEEEGTYTIVVGKPLRLNGQSEIQVEKIEKFSEDLKNACDKVDIKYMDERYTTKQAEYYLKNFSKKNAKQKRQVVDMIAATIILQTYLDKIK